MQRIDSPEDGLDRWLAWLRGHGVEVAVVPDLVHEPDHDGALVADDQPLRAHHFDGLPELLEHRLPPQVAADHATLSVAQVLIRSGDCEDARGFVDVGCGTGLLAAVAAASGAERVVGTDLDERAAEVARHTLEPFGERASVVVGPLLEPVPADAVLDVVAANLPHKPVPADGRLTMAQNGGTDGCEVHDAFLAELVPRTTRGGVVTLFLHSLPHPRLLRHYQRFFDLELWSWKLRRLQRDEYPTLLPRWASRVAAGTSLIVEDDRGLALVSGVFRGVRR